MTEQDGTDGPQKHPPTASGSSTGLMWIVVVVVWAIAKMFFSGTAATKPVAAAARDQDAAKSAEKLMKILQDNDYANHVVDAYRGRR
jgi:hypothetical protein